MKTNILLDKILAITGTVMVWLPIAGTLIFSVIGTVQNHAFLFDYLMPAEFFPFAIVCSGVLLWAGIRAHYLARPISWALDGVVGFLVLTQGVAILTGLSNGTVKGGWQLALLTAFLAGYILSVIIMGILGIRLVKKLFNKTR